MQEKIAKLKIKLKGQVQLKGAKHLLWDQIAAEVAKLWEYISFINDKNALVIMNQTKCEIVRKHL